MGILAHVAPLRQAGFSVLEWLWIAHSMASAGASSSDKKSFAEIWPYPILGYCGFTECDNRPVVEKPGNVSHERLVFQSTGQMPRSASEPHLKRAAASMLNPFGVRDAPMPGAPPRGKWRAGVHGAPGYCGHQPQFWRLK